MNLGDDEPIEWHWAKASFIIPKKLICNDIIKSQTKAYNISKKYLC